MLNRIYTYRTNDGNAYYKFFYIDHGAFCEIVIMEQPSYNSRDSSLHTTHRIDSSIENKKQVCIKESKKTQVVGTFEQAQSVSMAWAEGTNHFIKTGITIDDQIENRTL